MWMALTQMLPEKRGDRLVVVGGLALTIVLLFLLFGPSRVSQSERGQVIGGIEPLSSVRRRHARNLAWRDLGEATELFEGDYVYVPKGQTARVSLNDGKRVLEIPSDTLVQFDRSTIESLVVNLFGGFYLRPSNNRLLPYLPAVEPFELRHQEFMQRFLSKVNGKSGAVEPNDGALKPLALNSLSHFELILLAPEKGQSFRFGPDTWIDVLWTPIPLSDTQFELQIAKDPDFRFMAPYQSQENGVALNFRAEGKYYWRVLARRGAERMLSKPSFFDVSRFAPTLKLLDNLSRGVAGGFLTEVSQDRRFRKLVASRVAGTKSCPEEGLPPGTYFCRVRDAGSNKIVDEYTFRVD